MPPNLQAGRARQWVPGLPSLRSVARDDVAFDDGFGFIIAMGGYVYILASRKHGTLYTGVTSNLEGRVWEHREDITGGFTKRYDVKRLVWYRDYSDIRDAIDDEKRIKRWRRKWKLELIEAINPQRKDLYEDLANSETQSSHAVIPQPLAIVSKAGAHAPSSRKPERSGGYPGPSVG